MKNTCKIPPVFSLTNSLIFIYSSVYFIHTTARFYLHFFKVLYSLFISIFGLVFILIYALTIPTLIM